MKRTTKKKVSKKRPLKTKTKSKPKAKVIVIRTSREERPRMRDSVASGFGAGFGVAAGHEVGEWLLNPERKGRRLNPDDSYINLLALAISTGALYDLVNAVNYNTQKSFGETAELYLKI